jgi:hypothetical protein
LHENWSIKTEILVILGIFSWFSNMLLWPDPRSSNSRKPQINFRLHLQILNFQFYRENLGIFSCLFPGSIHNSVINVSFGISSNFGI